MHSSEGIGDIVKEAFYPRHYAIIRGKVDDLVVELWELSLEELTEAVNEKDDKGNTLLYYTANCLNKAVINFLLKKGTSPLTDSLIRELGELSAEKLTKAVNDRDDQGNTLLHYAAKNLCEVAVRFLLKKGASPFLENSDKKTPLDLVQIAQEEYVKDLTQPWVNQSCALIKEIYGFFENVRKISLLLNEACVECSNRKQYYTNRLFDYADNYLSTSDIIELQKKERTLMVLQNGLRKSMRVRIY